MPVTEFRPKEHACFIILEASSTEVRSNPVLIQISGRTGGMW